MKKIKLRFTGLELYWLMSLLGLFLSFIIYPIFSYIFDSDITIFSIVSLLLILITIIAIFNNFNLLFLIIPLIILKIFFYLNLNPIVTSDELNYYTYALEFSNSADVLKSLSYYFNKNVSIDIFAFVEPLIGYIYSSIIILSDSDSPYFIYSINLSVIILALGLYTSIFKFNNKYYLLLLVWIIFSPYLSYWGTRFFKDYISLLVICYSLYTFINKKFFLFTILIILATCIRSYSIVIFAIYFLFWKKNLYLTFLCALISFITSLIIYPGTITKYFKIFAYFLISPNPLNSENYNFIMGTQIIEAIFIFVLITLGLITNRKLILNTLFCISIYSSCIYMVDNRLTYSWNLSSDTITENYHRKKIPIFPILMLTSLSILLNKKYKQDENCGSNSNC